MLSLSRETHKVSRWLTVRKCAEGQKPGARVYRGHMQLARGPSSHVLGQLGRPIPAALLGVLKINKELTFGVVTSSSL